MLLESNLIFLMESTSHTEEAVQEAEEVMKKINGRVIVLPYFPSQSSTSIKNLNKRKKLK